MLKRLLLAAIILFTPFLANASILGVQQGGTGAGTFTQGNCIIGEGINPFQSTPCSSGGSTFATTSVSATYPILWNTSTAVISTAISTSTISNLPDLVQTGTITSGTWQGTAIADSYISSASTWNAKQAALSLVAGTYSNGDVCTYASSGTLLNCNTALPTGTVTSVTGTYPIQSTGGTTPVISTAFGTTTTAGIGNDLMLYTSHTGVIIGASTSTLNIGGNAATVTTNANLTGAVTSSGNATTYAGTLGNSLGGTNQNSSAWSGLAAVNAGVWSSLSTTSMNASITGNAGTATALQNARTINGVSFNGTANIVVASTTLLSSDNNTFSGNTIFVASTTHEAQVNLVGASSTLFSTSNLWDTALTSGDCVQASTNGLLTTTGSACGSGGGGGITALGNYATTTGTTISFSTSTQSFQGATFGQSIVMSTNGVLFTPIITGTLTAASSTLLSSDNNTFSGHTIFAASTTMQAQLNLQQASSTNFSASGTVYADNFYDTSAAGSSCIGDSSGILENGNCVASIASSGGTITYSSPTGSVNGDIALGHKNWWTGLQQFTNASSTLFEATSTVWLDNTKSALLLTDSNGKVGVYGGASACTNQFVTALSALGASTCGSVVDADFSGQLGLAHGGTNASLTGASGLVAMNSGNTALTIPSTGYTLSSTLLTAPNASTTNLTAASFADSALTSGDCVKATTGGYLLSAAAACGTGTVTSVSGTANQITSSGGTTPTLSLPNLVLFPLDASSTELSVFSTSYFGGTGTTTISSTGAVTSPSTVVDTFPNASTTNLTAGTSLQIPSGANPEPTVKAYCSQSTNSPYQIQCGNNAGGTSVYDSRTGISFYISSTTAMTASTTEVVAVPTGFTATSGQCTVQPSGGTAEVEWYYANPTAYTSVAAHYWNASSTPGQNAISSNNTPATNATSTMTVGNFTGSPTSVACNVFGAVTGI